MKQTEITDRRDAIRAIVEANPTASLILVQRLLEQRGLVVAISTIHNDLFTMGVRKCWELPAHR